MNDIPLADNPAFPTDNEAQTGPNTWHFPGMTYRQWLAGLAMQGFLAKETRTVDDDKVAVIAVSYADALIAELSKP